MGVLSKLLESNQQPTVGGPSATTSTPPVGSSRSSGVDVSTWPDPAPCPKCACPAFWIDVYGGGPHCRNCSKPSSPSLVKFHVWVLDTDLGFEWVGDPRRDARAEQADSDLVAFDLPDGRRVTAVVDRVAHDRVADSSGRYSPALACGPVGDLSADEWFDRLPDLQDTTSHPKAS